MVGCDNPGGDKTPVHSPGTQIPDNGDGNPNDNDDIPDGGGSNQLFRVDFSELSSWVGYNAEITLRNEDFFIFNLKYSTFTITPLS